MCAYRYQPMNVGSMKTRSIHERASKVNTDAFARPYTKGEGLPGLVDSLPDILAGREFRKLVRALQEARARNRAIIWGLGGHVIKCGLGPVLCDLLRRKLATAFALNGAAAIHDFEIAMTGSTSEDVEQELPQGDFGISRETGEWMNEAINQGVTTGMGMGESLGVYLSEKADRFPHSSSSLLSEAYASHVPVTVHVAVGTDTIHTHPFVNGALTGEGSLRDFRLLMSIACDLHDGGVYLNCGSAVILPEVFLKVVNQVRNLGHPLEGFTTANLDFLHHYRPALNVLKRPVLRSGQGISLTGHHELMIPLLAAVLVEECE